MNSLLLGIAGSGKTQECIRRASEALGAGRRVLYLVPNREEAALVRARLLDLADRRAAFLPDILTPGALVRRVLEAADSGCAPRSGLARRLALTRLLSEGRGKLGRLEDSAATPGFAEVLDRLLSELVEGQLSPEDLRALPGPRPAALAEIFEAYLAEQSASPLYDPAPAMQRAAESLEGRPERIAPMDLLLVDGFSNLSPLQLRLTEALMARAEATTFSLCMEPGDLDGPPRPPFERLHRLASRFAQRQDWHVEALSETPRFSTEFPERLARELFRKLPGEAEGEPSENLELMEAASRRDEAEAIARELRKLLAEGVDAGRLAVLYRDAELGEILAATLERARLPFQSRRKSTLGRGALAGFLIAMLDWQANGGGIDLLQKLRGGYLGLDDELLVRLQAEGRRRGLPAEEDWTEFLSNARLEFPDADWDWLDWCLSLSEGKLEGRAWLDHTLRPLIELVSAKLQEAFVRNEGGGITLLAAELRDLEDILAAARSLATEALPAGERQSAAAWLAAFTAALDSVETRRAWGGEGGGILLGNPFEMRLPELDTVFVAGLSRGSFPPPHREDPLLRESERQQLNRACEEAGRSARLPLRADRQAEERYLFYIAATRASRRLVLSWSVRDLEGRVTPPSFFLDELARIAPLPPSRFVPGKSLDEKFARPVGLRDLLRNVLVARHRGLSGGLVDEAEAFLREQELGGLLDAFAARPAVESLEKHPRLAMRMALEGRFSPTGLETFAHCPYRYLMERVLRLEEDEILEAGPREEGLLYHKVLELFFSRWDGDTSLDDLDERLIALHAEAVDALIEEGETSLRSRRFRLEDSRRLRLLSGYLARDLERLSVTGMIPEKDSLESDLFVDSSKLPGEGGEFRLLGRADRVDRSADGRRLVIDYKRSARSLESPKSDAPMSFQLPVYAWGLPEEERLGAAFAAVNDADKTLRGYYRKMEEGETLEKQLKGKWLDGDQWDAWLEKVAARIRALVDEIARGRFDPNPADGGEGCESCSVRQLCRWEEGESPRKGGEDEPS